MFLILFFCAFFNYTKPCFFPFIDRNCYEGFFQQIKPTTTRLLFMKKMSYKDLIIHSLELRIFLIELDKILKNTGIEIKREPETPN